MYRTTYYVVEAKDSKGKSTFFDNKNKGFQTKKEAEKELSFIKYDRKFHQACVRKVDITCYNTVYFRDLEVNHISDESKKSCKK